MPEDSGNSRFKNYIYSLTRSPLIMTKIIIYGVLGICLIVMGFKIVGALLRLNDLGVSFKDNTTEITINEQAYFDAMDAWDNLDYKKAEIDFKTALESSNEKNGIGSLESAAISQKLGSLYLEMGRYSDAYENLNSAYVTFNKELGESDGNTVIAFGQIALYDIKVGNIEKGFASFNDLYDTATYINHKIQAAQMIAQCNIELGNYEKAIEWYDILGEMYYQFDIVNTGRVNLLNDYGVLMITIGNYQEAITSLSSAVSTWEQLGLEEDETIANVYSNLAQAYAGDGQGDKAKETYQKALNIQERLFGSNSIHVALSYSALSGMHETMDDKAAQKQYLDKALQIALDSVGVNHMSTATIYLDLGYYYKSSGEIEMAIECHEKALEIRKNILGTKNVNTILIYEALAEDYRSAAEYATAIENAEYAVEIAEELYGRENIYSAHSYITAAWAYSDIEDYEKSSHYATMAIEICDRQKEMAGVARPYAYQTVGYVALSEKNIDEAIDYLKKAITLYGELTGKYNTEIATTNIYLSDAYLLSQEYTLCFDALEEAAGQFEQQVNAENHILSITNRQKKLYEIVNPDVDFESWLNQNKK